MPLEMPLELPAYKGETAYERAAYHERWLPKVRQGLRQLRRLARPARLAWAGYAVAAERQLEKMRASYRNARGIIRAYEADQAALAEAEVPSPSPSASAGAAAGDVWAALAQCESGGDWAYNGPSGFDGGLQFHPGTWSAYAAGTGYAYAWQAPAAVQIQVAERVQAAQGWGAWPACAAQLGLL